MIRSPGNEFRDQVAGVLAAKFRNVITEFALTGKKADIFFCEPLFPIGQRKIAVECKAWKDNPLRSRHIAAIRSEYDPAFEANEIDSLWIVTGLAIEALPKRSTAPYGQALQVFSFAELQNSVINFHDYLTHLIEAFNENGLSSYYIETFTEDGQNLHEDIVVPWLKSDAAKPLAIFGGYGIGKSSYAKRLASFLADKALRNYDNRIPILLSLGGLTQAQSIRDLITVQFAAEHRVDGFNYPLFAKLNELGRFVLIFDGFDEMKHAMRRRDIETNLQSISQLVSPASKVLVLGKTRSIYDARG
jgi:NACHT domain